MIKIGQLVSEIFMFESVDARTDAHTDGRQLESHTISSPWAFGSGELKMHILNINIILTLGLFNFTFILCYNKKQKSDKISDSE